MPSAFGKPVTTANRFGAAAAASALTLVTTLTASTSATLSYTSFASASYKSYKIVFNNLLPTTNGANFRVQGSTDGGLNYGALWSGGLVYVSATSVFWFGESVTTNFQLTYITASSASFGYLSGELLLSYSPVAGGRPTLTGTTGHKATDVSQPAPTISQAIYDSGTELNALKFLFSAGNIGSGTIRIYGLT